MKHKLDTALDPFFDYLVSERGLLPKTVEAYGHDLRAYMATLDEVQGLGRGRIPAEALELHLSRLVRRGLAAGSRARALSAIRHFHSFLLREGIVTRIDNVDVVGPKKRRRVPTVLTIQQIERLLNVPDDSPLGVRDRAMLEIAYAAGLRVSELCAGQPIMPGVLILEALAQMGGILLSQELKLKGKVAVLLSVDRAKFRRPVVPGDQLILEVESLRIKSRTGHVMCRAKVGEILAAEASLKFMMADADPW